MFKKIRRSLKDHKTRPDAGHSVETGDHVCHACGQSLRQPGGASDEFVARPYELYEPRDRSSWSGSGFSDSGYGSFSSSQNFESMFQLGATQPTTCVQPSARRSTYTTSIYSDDDHMEDLSLQETPAEPAHMDTLDYDHLFDVPPRSFSKSSERWKPRSRYARLNELPAASPETLALNYDAFAASDAAAFQEGTEPEKKRKTIRRIESLVLRPSQLGRLASRRMRFQ